MKGKKENKGAETKNDKLPTATPTDVNKHQDDKERTPKADPPPSVSNSKVSLEAILTGVNSTERNWPRDAYRAILTRWKQMPRGGWEKTISIYCDKFDTKISDVIFKKRAKTALTNEAGSLIRVRHFNEEACAKRIKSLDEVCAIASLKESAEQAKIDKEFIEMFEVIKKQDLTKIEPTSKISSLKVNTKVIEMLNESIGTFLLRHKIENMSDIATILQAAQHTYEKVTKMPIKPSNWEESIQQKISKLSRQSGLLKTYKTNKGKLSKGELSEVKRMAGTKKCALQKPTDIDKLISFLETRVLVYKQKILTYRNRREWRKENTLFELYRGRFYRQLQGETPVEHEVSQIEIENFWGKMWENTDEEDEHKEDKHDEYIREFHLDLEETQIFPSNEEFTEIVNRLPCWKAAGPDIIFNYFIKKMKAIHPHMYKIIRDICLHSEEQEDWFYKGITYLIPKGVPSSGKDFRPITCMSNLYKLTTKCATEVIQQLVERKKILSENQMGTVRKVQGAKEQALTNIAMNKAHNYKLKTVWVDVKKAFDSVNHKYLLKCIEALGMCPWITSFLKSIISRWNLEIRTKNKVILNKKVNRGILQGDSLSPLLFVLCLDPLSKRLNGIFPKVEVKTDERNYMTNHLLFIDDLKLFAHSEDTLKNMVDETENFFKTIGLEMNKDKSATNAEACQDKTRILETQEGYKYLGLTESRSSKLLEENTQRIVKAITDRVETLCKTKLNAKHLITAINQHALSVINYYIGILNVEPDIYREIDDKIRGILIKHHIHQQPACKERLYLSRKELGRGLVSIELKSERMLLELVNVMKSTQETCLRRKMIIKTENEYNTHLSNIQTFLKMKYEYKEDNLGIDELKALHQRYLYSDIKKKINHSKLYRINEDPNIASEESATWLMHGNISPREEGSLCALQDRNIFLEKGGMCPHCNEKTKTVDHMATQCDRMLSHDYMRRHDEALKSIHLQMCIKYGFKGSKKIRNHSVQECISNERAEIRVDTRIQGAIKIKYNKPDIFIVDKVKKEIVIIEVGITSFDNLRTVEVEKKHKYDLLANHCGSMYKYRTRIIPYVMTWEGVVTKYHKEYRKEIGLDRRVEAYVQSRVLKMTLESLTLDSRRGSHTWEHEDLETKEATTESEDASRAIPCL